MGRFSLAWRILTDGIFARRVQQRLAAEPSEAAVASPAVASVPVVTAAAATPVAAPAAPRPVAAATGRSDALSLLAALQREGRLLDFLQEPIDGYSDAQVGAAVRDIHRNCAAVLERQFAVRPVLDQPEGSVVTFSQPVGPQLRLTGAAAAGSSGRLVHSGWQATKCDLPVWQGDASAAKILAPAEIG